VAGTSGPIHTKSSDRRDGSEIPRSEANINLAFENKAAGRSFGGIDEGDDGNLLVPFVSSSISTSSLLKGLGILILSKKENVIFNVDLDREEDGITNPFVKPIILPPAIIIIIPIRVLVLVVILENFMI